jgi:hypothetical protein
VFSVNNLRQRPLVDRKVGDRLTQSAVLFYELPGAFDLGVTHAAELLPPAAQHLRADHQLLTDLRHSIAARRQLIGLTQLPDDLVGCLSLVFHRADLSGALFAPKDLTRGGSNIPQGRSPGMLSVQLPVRQRQSLGTVSDSSLSDIAFMFYIHSRSATW